MVWYYTRIESSLVIIQKLLIVLFILRRNKTPVTLHISVTLLTDASCMTLRVWQQTIELVPEVFRNSSEYLKIKVFFFQVHFMVNLVRKLEWVFQLFQIVCETRQNTLPLKPCSMI